MSKEMLKSKFATGAKPTGSDFSELIDEIFAKVSPSELGDLSATLTQAINAKANSEDVDRITDEILLINSSLANYLTEEDLTEPLSTKANKIDVYTKEEVEQSISTAVSELQEEISLLRDEIELLKGVGGE